ncbi:hypothetical protein LSTR_LSTR006247 [Laodelphax striatellus]|uniref:Uncharacterized protein n=1 Tax=Laodelphax striatellus TaxID=195883 RepID=A0A482XS03_LAOST|nr:hypothetical protein LSTR_LSTR006247 [Laodelphax striatellus]
MSVVYAYEALTLIYSAYIETYAHTYVSMTTRGRVLTYLHPPTTYRQHGRGAGSPNRAAPPKQGATTHAHAPPPASSAPLTHSLSAARSSPQPSAAAVLCVPCRAVTCRAALTVAVAGFNLKCPPKQQSHTPRCDICAALSSEPP